ncbi:hypothetical protein DDP51_08325 [Helicobacter pylori]|nr:hypothetical protein DDP51_08325 [Helicobacter pylori]
MVFNHSIIQSFNHSTIQPSNQATLSCQSFNHSIFYKRSLKNPLLFIIPPFINPHRIFLQKIA